MLGMRKSSSLENLQTMMQDLQRQQLESKGGNPFGGPRPATLKVSRSRTTNESFRVAVDRSYDPPVDQENMEPGMHVHQSGISRRHSHLFVRSQGGFVRWRLTTCRLF